jgi:hypothetical protein
MQSGGYGYRVISIAFAFIAALSGSVARADIAGFNNLVGWTYNQPDAGTPADLPNSGTVHLTTGNGQRRSIFFNAPQNITQFSASFTYRATNMNASLVGQGIGLVLQNSPSGAMAVGGGNGGLGYTGITNSATTILFGDTGPGQTFNGYFTGGTISSGSNSTSPANLFNFRDLNVTATYNNPILTVTVDDPLIAGFPDFNRNYVVGNLATTIGNSFAYVGFTASTGDGFGNGGSNQYLSNFAYTVPEPGSLGFLIWFASVGLVRRRR